MKLRRAFPVLIVCLLVTALTFAQTADDLSRVRSSQITDAQLVQYVNQAKMSGLTAEDVEQQLLKRGMPVSEVDLIKQRIKALGLDEDKADTTSSYPGTDSKMRESGRQLPKSREKNPLVISNEDFRKRKPQLFGSELFSNNNLSFEPDMRMATPLDYTIGPDDELQLTIYGTNMSQQSVKVNPEGNINVKYAGLVNVSGMTIEAARSVLQERLKRFYPGLQSGETKLQLSLGDIRTIRVILIGAIKRPGTYTLPSLASLFNALYASGGPSENGSFRQIELLRNNRVIQKADLYDFLVNGNLRTNIRLQDNDVIRVPYATTLVTLTGEVNRPAIFETLPAEHLSDVIQFAGGFKSRAFRSIIRGTRFTDFEKSIIDVSKDSLNRFTVQNGDEFVVDSLVDRYLNRVMITGAVFKPGAYALQQGMTLKDLITKAQGVKEDVFTGRAVIVRKRADLTREFKTIQLSPIIAGESVGVFLQREDSVVINSLFDLRDTAMVTINGAVRIPGNYRFEDSLTLKSLIMMAGGYAENATGMGIEIARRKRDVQVNKPGSQIVDLIEVNDDKNLSSSVMDMQLSAFDIITIKEDPFYKKQITVKITGEVLMPSSYSLQSREERLSSIIKRSGGLLYTANINGAKLIRVVKDSLDAIDIRRLINTMERDTTIKDDSLLNRTTKDIAINLRYILDHPGSRDDIILEDGDELVVPRVNNTINVYGEVFHPVGVMFESGKHFRDYLSDAGGITQRGKKGRAFVIYSNGSAAKIKHRLGVFRVYPRIEPGASIFVPQKPKRDGGVDAGKVSILVSAVTALITAVALFTR